MTRVERPLARRLRIAIDARYLSHGLVGGVHSYQQVLLPALIRNGAEHDFVLWIDDKAPFDLPDLAGSVEIRVLPWRNELSSMRNDLGIGRAMLRDGADVAHFPANYGLTPPQLPAVVTLHDAINVLPLREILRGHSKDARTMLMMNYLHAVTRMTLRQCPFIITISDYSRRDIMRYTRTPAERIAVLHRSPDPSFRVLEPQVTEHIRSRRRLRRRVLLADAIKNPECTLRAYRELPYLIREQTSLVFFARRTPKEAVQQAAAAGECLVFTGLTREGVIELYNVADLFIFPSWYEGFGLPAIEAMACGTPVIASSRASLPEVVGDGGIVTDVDDYRAIAREIVRLLDDDAAYRALRERALARALLFSPDIEAKQVLEVYSRVAVSRAQARSAKPPAVPVARKDEGR